MGTVCSNTKNKNKKNILTTKPGDTEPTDPIKIPSYNDPETEKQANIYIENAKVFLRKREFKNALEVSNKAGSILESNKNENHIIFAKLKNLLGLINYSKGDLQKALTNFNESLNIVKNLNEESDFIASIYNNRAAVYDNLSEYTKAMQDYELSFGKYKSKNNYLNQAKVKLSMGIICKNKKKLDEAIHNLNQCIDLVNSLKDTNNQIKIIANNELGMIRQIKGEYDEAIKHYKISLNEVIENLGEKHTFCAGCYNNIGYAYKNKADYKLALENYNKAKDIHLEALGKNHLSTATSYNNLASVYESLGNVNEAIENYYLSLEILDSLLDDNNQIKSNILMSLFRLLKQDKISNQKIMDNLIGLTQRNKDSNSEISAICYFNLGLYYKETGDHEKAMINFKNSSVIYDKLSINNIKTARCNFYLGINSLLKGEYKDSIECLKKSLTFFNNDHNCSVVNNVLGICYLRTGNLEVAEKHFNWTLNFRKAFFGENSNQTIDIKNNLGVLFLYQSKPNDAINIFNSFLNNKKILDLKTESIYTNNVGVCYYLLKDFINAEDHFIQSFKNSLYNFGEDNHNTICSFNHLKLTYIKKGLRYEDFQKFMDRFKINVTNFCKRNNLLD